MYRIGDFSKMSKTTIKTLRYYDETGLLKPEFVDATSNYRFYSTDQLFKLHTIKALRQIGLSVNETKLVINGHQAKELLEKRKFELEDEIARGTEQLSRIEFILSGQEEECMMNYQARIKELPECIVYSKKMTVPNYDAYFKLIPEIGDQVTKKYPDLKCTVPEYCFIVYLDNEFKEKDFHVEFCEAVREMKEDFDDIKFKKIQGTTAVSVMHKGGYEGLSEAYAYVFKWIDKNSYEASDNPRESYIDGIWNKERKEDWLTELQVPIKKR